MKAIIILLCISITIVNATQYWVSPFGSDTNNGKSQTSPFKTFTKAVSVTINGDVVTAMPGLYTGDQNTIISIYDSITINSTAGVQQTVITGPGGWRILESVTITGLQFTNFPTNVFIIDNFSSYSSETFTLNNVVMYSNNRVISLESDYNYIHISNSNFTDNTIILSHTNTHITGSVVLSNSTFTNSGAVIGYYDDVVVYNSTFQHNKCAFNGCALSLNRTSSLIVNQTTFLDVSSLSNGGAIFLSALNPDVRILDSLFKENSAVGNGGAIYSMDSIEISVSVFDSNTADVGGAIYLLGTFGESIGANIVGTEFYQNTAQTSAGALFCEYNVVSYQYVEFHQNYAPQDPSYQCGTGCSSILFHVVDDNPSTCSSSPK